MSFLKQFWCSLCDISVYVVEVDWWSMGGL